MSATVNQMIIDLTHGHGSARQILMESGLDGVCDHYQLSDKERSALRDGGWRALEDIGVPPNLQMALGVALKPNMREMLSMVQFMERYMKEVKTQA